MILMWRSVIMYHIASFYICAAANHWWICVTPHVQLATKNFPEHVRAPIQLSSNNLTVNVHWYNYIQWFTTCLLCFRSKITTAMQLVQPTASAVLWWATWQNTRGRLQCACAYSSCSVVYMNVSARASLLCRSRERFEATCANLKCRDDMCVGAIIGKCSIPARTTPKNFMVLIYYTPMDQWQCMGWVVPCMLSIFSIGIIIIIVGATIPWPYT